MIQPPTSRLPPISKITAFTSAQLSESLQYLHSLYRPQVRGSRRRRRDPREQNSLSPVSPLDDVQQVAFDAFERAYAIRWLTALIAQLEARQEQSWSPPTITDAHTGVQPLASIDTDTLIQQAASLLATCAGVAAAPKVHRRFSFESPVLLPTTGPGGIDSNGITRTVTVHVDLTDVPLDNHDYASVGAQTWGGACVLAEMIAERPDRFGLRCMTGCVRYTIPPAGSDRLHTHNDHTPLNNRAREHPLRILELGAGTGLVGLTIAKLLQASVPPCKNPDTNRGSNPTVILTDFYPAVLANLQSNIDTNFSTAPDQAAIVVRSHPLDWSSFSPTTKTPPIHDMLSTPFDLVFGADIVYEAQHAVWIRDCLESLLSHPDGLNQEPVFHLVIPLRPTHAFESSTIEQVFVPRERSSEGLQRELTILSKESIICEAYGDGGSERGREDDDVEYVYYRIGWTR